MGHLNLYHNLGNLRNALRNKYRNCYLHNTTEIRDVLANLQRYGYIGRFIAVHEPFQPRISRKIQKRVSKERKEESPYLLVFLKYRQSNKHLPVIGNIYFRKRPTRYQIPVKTKDMKPLHQGVGLEMVRVGEDKRRREDLWIPTHTAQIRGLDGYKGFKVFS
mmetsp:Transcript_5882/g.9412  ORF Transcript_5882/g.9412 Transcript_5882/m.9412 type:complete len:162 (+) Transcript_5882:37-522(+)|eukprot:CAMPEP_0202690920 /NCGR_PEP_ID=MMETSP1385-20130828/5791_1 /ASSEMBLY_ACC=CAM_ASM_000861 /TAXON_ID=933848 /ORGANISM="Elphidium margaritaceum" /LENGTH=161 /DNA_ID=CAMNT_0049346255 /DNA_START=14 /DNA_END=499 /DNA_ORIENTATION=+